MVAEGVAQIRQKHGGAQVIPVGVTAGVGGGHGQGDRSVGGEPLQRGRRRLRVGQPGDGLVDGRPQDPVVRGAGGSQVGDQCQGIRPIPVERLQQRGGSVGQPGPLRHRGDSQGALYRAEVLGVLGGVPALLLDLLEHGGLQGPQVRRGAV